MFCVHAINVLAMTWWHYKRVKARVR